MSLFPAYSIKYDPDRTLLTIPCSAESLAKAGGLLVHSDEKKGGPAHQKDEKSGLTNLKSELTETVQRILELMK